MLNTNLSDARWLFYQHSDRVATWYFYNLLFVVNKRIVEVQ